MAKVMEKLRGAAEAGAPASPPDVTGGAATSAFVAAAGEPEARRPPARRVAAWDAQRVDPSIVAFHERHSAICEQYRGVRARLRALNPAGAHQVIAITSSLPREGKSVTALNLGLVLAEGGEQRVLVADADFRRASVARMLGIPEAPGLAELLSGQCDFAQVVRPTPWPNLSVVPAGALRTGAYADVLSRPAVRAVLAGLRRQYEYTILDTPPVTAVSDVSLLGPLCDGVILVVALGRTPEPIAQEAVRTLQASGVRLIGGLVSQVRERCQEYHDRASHHPDRD